jgi:hypothetical protein
MEDGSKEQRLEDRDWGGHSPKMYQSNEKGRGEGAEERGKRKRKRKQ